MTASALHSSRSSRTSSWLTAGLVMDDSSARCHWADNAASASGWMDRVGSRRARRLRVKGGNGEGAGAEGATGEECRWREVRGSARRDSSC